MNEVFPRSRDKKAHAEGGPRGFELLVKEHHKTSSVVIKRKK